LQEAAERKRFDEVVEYFPFEAFDGIVAVGGGDDDQGAVGQAFQEVEPGELGHLDIEEEQVDVVLLQLLKSLYGVVCGGDRVNVEVLQVVDDDVDGQRFIVYDEAMDTGHERGIFRVTW
jgi:hypothetical protein